MDREDFESVVLKVVKEFSFQGPPDIRLMLKFRCLRRALSAWRNESEAKEKEEENTIKEDLIHLEKELEVRDLVKEELWALEEGMRRISQSEAFHLRDLRQRTRNRWAKEEDANSKFFHGLINRRRESNFIPGIDINGVWKTKPSEVKKEVFGFFNSKFKEEIPIRPKLSCFSMKSISEQDSEAHIKEFTDEEIKGAIFDCLMIRLRALMFSILDLLSVIGIVLQAIFKI
ncbi:uncharacterized protein LOC143576172 [Bidens hawaiensis]|uniref:uncharacterized protein LOC143576172 n=1 Tax=Bidens hawaiensis TaxID=980011 RepID=UPI0040490AB5